MVHIYVCICIPNTCSAQKNNEIVRTLKTKATRNKEFWAAVLVLGTESKTSARLLTY